MAEAEAMLRAEPGMTLADGRYRLQRRLGAGGMATVWLARDERLQRPVAIKLIADTLSGDESWLRRFTREARAAAALSHRGVVPVFDYGVQDGRPYLVMEYIAGGNLAQRLDPELARAAGSTRPTRRPRSAAPASPPLPPPVQLARELLEALAGVHAAGILHRDVKPANLLIDAAGHLRLTDFGIAQTLDATSLTKTGMIVGTLRYIAPEVAAGGPATAASDLYSAGMVIRQLAGEPPAAQLAPLIEALTADAPQSRPRSAADALALLDATPTGPTKIASAAGQTARAQVPAGATGQTARAQAPVTAATFARAATRTRALTQATRIRSAGAPAPVAVPRGPLGNPRAMLGALAALIAVIVIVAIVAGAGGGSSAPAAAPHAAPASAPLSQQIGVLEQIVSGARKR
jgi:serine/threonine protein kinase